MLGPHGGRKVVLALQEIPGCNHYWMTQFAQWENGRARQALQELALATHKSTKPLCVEYVSSSADGYGRLYARLTCAQQLPRELRLLLYGNTHKEVDISGAHYELIRVSLRSSSLPPIRELQKRLRRACNRPRNRILLAENYQLRLQKGSRTRYQYAPPDAVLAKRFCSRSCSGLFRCYLSNNSSAISRAYSKE